MSTSIERLVIFDSSGKVVRIRQDYRQYNLIQFAHFDGDHREKKMLNQFIWPKSFHNTNNAMHLKAQVEDYNFEDCFVKMFQNIGKMSNFMYFW